MEDIVKRFLSISHSYGSDDFNGCVDVDGYGLGDGHGFGSGHGYGNGFSTGHGFVTGEGDSNVYHRYRDKSGYDDGYDDGYVYDNGSGYGDIFGSGDGSGEDSGIKTYNGHEVSIIDDTPTIIYCVHGDIAQGAILQLDLTLKDCYIARADDCFAHGDTAAEAMRDAVSKALWRKPIEERIASVISQYKDIDAQIDNKELFTLHNTLTGSCLMGRNQFAKEHGIDVEHGSMTMREFIELTKNAYGGSNIAKLEEAYKQDNAVTKTREHRDIVFMFFRTDLANAPLPTNSYGTMKLDEHCDHVFHKGLCMFYCDANYVDNVLTIVLQDNNNEKLSLLASYINKEDLVWLFPTRRHNRFVTTYQPFEILGTHITTNHMGRQLILKVDMSHCKKKYKLFNSSGVDLKRNAMIWQDGRFLPREER